MIIKELIKIANELDKRSLRVEADKLDSIIFKFAEDFYITLKKKI